MKELEFGGVVFSLAGHDKGELFVIIGTEGEYLILADGRYRTVAKPKRKKKKHVRHIKYQCSELKARHEASGRITDEMVRYELKKYRRQQTPQDGL